MRNDSPFKMVIPTKGATVDKYGNVQRKVITLQPGEVWTPWVPKKEKKCTCGIAAIGGGLHNEWCDKVEK